MKLHIAARCHVKGPVRRPIPGILTLLGIFLLPLLIASNSQAQISAATSSSGHSSSATSSSSGVSSPRHTSHMPASPGVTFSGPHSNHSSSGSNGHRHHRSASGEAYYYPYLYAVPFPYTEDANATDDADADDDEYQGGPTVFDRRGSGAASYVPPTYEGPAHAQDEESSTAATAHSDSPGPPTTLVFKDGRLLEIENYAIVSQTLYDLTPGHPRKIALADLDLPATEKQNDERGVTFQLPPSAQAN